MLSSIAQDFDAPTNRLYALKDLFLKEKRSFIDLVSGNVNIQGIRFPSSILSKALAGGLKQAAYYRPDPLGQKVARDAISRYYSKEMLKIPSDQIILTPGTSISYWYAFKVFANEGDEILCPTPSYPLFDSIAQLCGVKLVPYRLEEKARWEINFEHLESAITTRTKAIVLISPHNPTGAIATTEEIKQLCEIARRKNLAIISDEVFSPFLFGQKALPRPAHTTAPLVITLNGFSKMLALPGLKIGWMAITGDPALVKKTVRALDMISDTFLPVNEASQFAVPALLRQSAAFRSSYASKIRTNMELATTLLKEQNTVPGISFIQPEGGFFLTLKVDQDEDELVLKLLKEHHVLVHPGYFYDMDAQHLVMSFVNKPTILRKAL